MYKLVIFDLDGTLLNTIGDLAAAGNHTLEVMGFPQHTEESYRHFVGNGIPKLIERMLPAVTTKRPSRRRTTFSWSTTPPTSATAPSPTPAFRSL